jgi:hypothetical protein
MRGDTRRRTRRALAWSLSLCATACALMAILLVLRLEPERRAPDAPRSRRSPATARRSIELRPPPAPSVAVEAAPVASASDASPIVVASIAPEAPELGPVSAAPVRVGSFTPAPLGPIARDRRVSVHGRVAFRVEDRVRALAGAMVTLSESHPDPSIPTPAYESLPELLARIPRERRSQLRYALSEGDVRCAIVDLGSTPSGGDGTFSFDLDRQLLVEGSRFFVSVVAIEGGARLAGEGGPYSPPDVDEDVQLTRPNAIDTGVLRLERSARTVLTVRAQGALVEGAEVLIDGETHGRTDRFGRVELDETLGCSLTIVKEGFSIVTCELGADAEIALAPECRVAFHVTDEAGRPLACSVTAHRGGPQVVADSFADGRGVLRGLRAGETHWVTVECGDDWQKSTIAITPPCAEVGVKVGRAARLDVKLRFDESVLPRLVANHGLGCQLEARDEASGAWTVVSNSAFNNENVGSFAGLAPGLYRVYAGGGDQNRWALAFSAPVRLDPGRSASVALELGHGRVVGGWVVDEDGNAVSNLTIGIAESGWTTNTDSSGWLDVRVPTTTGVHLRFSGNGWEEKLVAISPGATSLGTIVLRRGR